MNNFDQVSRMDVFKQFLNKILIRKRVFLRLFFIFLIILVIYTIYLERGKLENFPWKLSIDYLILSSFFYCLFLVALFLVWHLMIQKFSGKVLWKLNGKIYFTSSLARRIPTPIWYLGSRFSMYPSQLVSREIIFTSSVLEIVIFLLIGIFYFCLFFAKYSFAINPLWIALSVFLGAFLIIFLTFPNILLSSINRVLVRLKRQSIDIVLDRGDILAWSAIYFIAWLLNAGSFFFLVNGIMVSSISFFDLSASATLYLLLAYVSMFLTAGFGLKELATSWVLTQWMPFSIGIAITLVFRILMILIEILFMLFWRIVGKNEKTEIISYQS